MSSEQHPSPSNASARNPIPPPQCWQLVLHSWRGGTEIETTRQWVRQKLKSYLLKGLGKVMQRLDMQRLDICVNRAEKSLFNNAKTKAEYEDPRTLRERLHQYIALMRSHTNSSGVPNSSLAPSSSPGNSSILAPAFGDMSVPSSSNQVHFQNVHAPVFNGGVSHGGNVQRIGGNMLYNYSSSAGNNQNLNQFNFGSNPFIPSETPPMVAAVHGASSNTIYRNGNFPLNNMGHFGQQIPNPQQSRLGLPVIPGHAPGLVAERVGLQILEVAEHGIGSLYTGSFDSQFPFSYPYQSVDISSMSLDRKDLQFPPQSLDSPSRIGSSPSISLCGMPLEIDIFGQCQGQKKDEDIGCAENEIKEAIVEPRSENNSGETCENSKKKVLSLTEMFTAEQMEEHIASIRQEGVKNNTGRSNGIGNSSNENESKCTICAEDQYFRPVHIFCSSCGERIKKDTTYHSATENDKTVSFCRKCFRNKINNMIPNIRIDKMEVKTHVEETVIEPWVRCNKCGSWQHQICALFNDKNNEHDDQCYTCPKCYIQEIQHGERAPLPPNSIPGAQELPRTSLSDHIENRLFASLDRERRERAAVLGKDLNEVEGAEGLTVRVVSSVDKSCKVNPRFRDALQRENYPQEFPYKSKAILVFQKIDAVDVIIFAMYSQEYGPECDYPNKDSVYISYLDSVKYLRPQIKTVHGEALRTFVFHELLIGYLDYCRRQGFAKCQIWTCPPKKKDDYIFYCHPDDQNIPTIERLRKWYVFMLDKAIQGNVAVASSYLYEQFYGPHSENKVTAANLPYFEGDYLPTIMDAAINSIKKGECVEKKPVTRSKRKIPESWKLNSCENSGKDILLMKKFKVFIGGPQEKNFIVVHLRLSCMLCFKKISSGKPWSCNQCKHFVLCEECYNKEQDHSDCMKPPTKYKKKHVFVQADEVADMILDRRDDENLCNKFIETREEFLKFCLHYSYQFDTLRRAKHSSAMILYHLHES